MISVVGKMDPETNSGNGRQKRGQCIANEMTITDDDRCENRNLARLPSFMVLFQIPVIPRLFPSQRRESPSSVRGRPA